MNGELVFAAPWESRSFGMAVALAESGRVEWGRFRQGLIAEIGAWEGDHGGGEDADWSYYACWLDSLQRLLVEGQLLDEEEILARTALLAHADDHDHDHDHGHGRGVGHVHDAGEDRAGRRA